MGTRGQPDWDTTSENTNLATFSDQAELAVRLGAVSLFDRDGKTAWFTNFEHGVSDINVVGGVEPSHVEIRGDNAFLGDTSLHILAKSNPLVNQGFIKILRPNRPGKMAFETTFSLVSLPETIIMQAWYVIDNIAIVSKVELKPKTDQFHVLLDTGVFSPYRDIEFMDADRHNFNTIKYIVDFENITYGRFMFNNITYDLTEHGVFTTGLGTRDAMHFRVFIVSDGVIDAEVYIDSAIITYNEV